MNTLFRLFGPFGGNPALLAFPRFKVLVSIALLTAGAALSSGTLAGDAAAVRGAFENPWPQTDPNATSAVFFSGYLDPQPAANGDPVISSFGQMVGDTVPFPDFQQVIHQHAEKLLYFESADNQPGYEKELAAFRYKSLVYGMEGTYSLASRYETMVDNWGAEEEQRAAEAEAWVAAALRKDPSHEGLRNLLLDIHYDRAVANVILAKGEERKAQSAALGLPGFEPLAGDFAISREITYLTQALPYYEKALADYLRLLSDPLGVDMGLVTDTQNSALPFGYHLYQTMVPQRHLEAAMYWSEGGDLIPVVDNDGDGLPDMLFSSYKDQVLLLEIMRDATRAAARLAKLYALRNTPASADDISDKEKALAVIGRAQQRFYTDGVVLEGIFPDSIYGTEDAEQSGLILAWQGWAQALADLSGAKGFVAGDTNLFGLPDDFLALVQYEDGDSYDYFEQQLIPGGSESGLSGALADAFNRYSTARASYQTFRTYQDQVWVELEQQRIHYGDRLRSIVGCAVPAVDPTPAGCDYATPQENVGGEIYLQLMNIQQAQLRIQKNLLEQENLQKQIEHEIERRGKEHDINDLMAKTIIDYGEKQAKLSERIGALGGQAAAISARSSMWSGIAGGLFGIAGGAFSLIPFSGQQDFSGIGSIGSGIGGVVSGIISGFSGKRKAKRLREIQRLIGKLQGEKERLAAMERAEIVYLNDQIQEANSAARVKNLLLGISTLVIESTEAAILLEEQAARLEALFDEKVFLEAAWSEAEGNLEDRFFADPAHRMVLNTDVLDAERTFRKAQLWLFMMARALDYKWNRTVNAEGYTAESVYKLRNADELVKMAIALYNYNHTHQLGVRSGTSFVKFSLREDFLGFKRTDFLGNTLDYPDPLTGESVDALTAFRSYLKNIAERVEPEWGTNREAIRLQFTTAKTNTSGTFFSPDRWNEKIHWVAMTINTDSPLTELMVWLEQRGVAFVRNDQKGVQDPEDPDLMVGEMTSYPVRYWYWRDNPVTGEQNFVSKDDFGIPVNAAIVIDPHAPIESLRKSEFREMSPAISQWTLEIPTIHSSGLPLLDLDKIRDVEIWFYNYYKVRN